MDITCCQRLDHLGVVMGIINELGIIEFIDNCLIEHVSDDCNVTPGQAVAAMIINGLGFTNRPLSLTPDFFITKDVGQLFGKNITAQDFNRHKLGRTLDQAYNYGCEQLFYEIATKACAIENIDTRFLSLDTTSISVDGEYSIPQEESGNSEDEEDEHEVMIVHGYSKDHRPDLKQVMVEMMCAQDGGVPLMVKCWSGNESDSTIFKKRTQEMIEILNASDAPKYLVADSKLYHQDNAPSLKCLNFITRIPASIKLERQTVKKAMEMQQWIELDENNKYQVISINHYQIEQRWIVVYSSKARDRVLKTLNRQVDKEKSSLLKQIRTLKKQNYHCNNDAKNDVLKMFKKSRYHTFTNVDIVEKDQNLFKINGVEFTPNTQTINELLDQRSCFVIATNAVDLTPQEAIEAYKRQNASVERGFRFLKSPTFFADSLYLKKPSRITALIMIMVLSLLVFSIAQRRLRAALLKSRQTIPNQIKKPIVNPTGKWAFFLLEGIDIVYFNTEHGIGRTILGITDLKRQIICCLGPAVMKIYEVSGPTP